MSDVASPWERRAHPTTPRLIAVAVGAALLALGLGAQGLLVPAGPASTWIRVVGACVALGAVGVLLRIDGPAVASRTLVVVCVAGALAGLATVPRSPVTLSGSAPEAGGSDEAPAPTTGEDATGTVVLERVGPGGGGSSSPALVLPEGATLVLDEGHVVLRMPDGSTAVLGRAAAPATGAPSAAPTSAGATSVVVTGGTVARSDGGPIGGDTALGGLALEASGRHVVVGDGVLLEVPEPLPTDRRDSPRPLTEGGDALLAVLLACFALLAFAPPVVRVADRAVGPRFRPEAPPSAEVDPADSGEVEEGLAEVLRSMLSDPEPRTAVIGAYARLLAALAEAGHPRRREETPHEHLWRVLGPLGVRRAPVHRLAELFVRARFTPRPVTAAHRDAAIGALADAVADLRLTAHDVIEVTDTVAAAPVGGAA